MRLVNTLNSFVFNAHRTLIEKLPQIAVVLLTASEAVTNKLQSHTNLAFTKLNDLDYEELGKLDQKDVQIEIDNLATKKDINEIFQSITKLGASLLACSSFRFIIDLDSIRVILHQNLKTVLLNEDILQEFPEFLQYTHLITSDDRHSPDDVLLAECRELLESTVKSRREAQTPDRKFYLAFILGFVLW
jgi:hypothetical protein